MGNQSGKDLALSLTMFLPGSATSSAPCSRSKQGWMVSNSRALSITLLVSYLHDNQTTRSRLNKPWHHRTLSEATRQWIGHHTTTKERRRVWDKSTWTIVVRSKRTAVLELSLQLLGTLMQSRYLQPSTRWNSIPKSRFLWLHLKLLPVPPTSWVLTPPNCSPRRLEFKSVVLLNRKVPRWEE